MRELGKTLHYDQTIRLRGRIQPLDFRSLGLQQRKDYTESSIMAESSSKGKDAAGTTEGSLPLLLLLTFLQAELEQLDPKLAFCSGCFMSCTSFGELLACKKAASTWTKDEDYQR